MQLNSPEWFFLIPAFAVVGFLWRTLQLWKPLRIIILLGIVLLLADPTFSKLKNSLDLWVLLDRSESTEDLIDKSLPEWRRLLESSKLEDDDRLRILDYASEVSEQGTGETSVFTGSRRLTRTKLALDTVLALAPKDRPSRVLLFTDGYSTEPLADTTDKLREQGIPVDYRLIRDAIADDFRVARIEMPARSQIAEPFVLGITVQGHTDTTIPLEVYRGSERITETEITLTKGVGKIEFTDRLVRPGSHQYRVHISPKTDAYPGNNHAERWIEITGGPRILLVTKYPDDPLAKSLQTQGFTVDLITKLEELHQGQLSGARACILNNVPAFEIPTDFLHSLDFFVREQGGGFLMVGGQQSFGAGGYFQSSIDELLPVSMELKNEHRKLSVALAIVMDRSGSMGVNVGAGKLTKMDLANQGAASAIELLSPMDYITVYAVDSEPHRIIPLTQIRNGHEVLMKRVKKIRSQGGGIYVYNGLAAAWDELSKSPAGTKHIILFSDAADSEQPGKYRQLIREITDANGTISVIGLGSKSDPDAALLKEISELGMGRIFYTNRPMEIPKIFAQETVTIARSAFIEEPVSTQATGQWGEISPTPLPWLSQVDGYNLSYLRPDSTGSLLSKDDYLAPLVAHARRGVGRTAAVSFPLGGDYSTLTRNWPKYGDFTQTLARWLMGSELPPGLGLKHRLEGTRLTLDLLYDPEEWAERMATHPPRIKIIEGDAQSVPYELSWKRISPGHFSLTRDLEEGTVIRGVVQVRSHALPFGPLVVGSASEWAFGSDRVAELRHTSAVSGGRALTDLSQAWLRPPVTSDRSIRVPLTLLVFFLILLDALVTRMGWKLPQFGARTSQQMHTPPVPTPQTSPPLAEPITEEPPVSSQARKSRYSRAKDRK